MWQSTRIAGGLIVVTLVGAVPALARQTNSAARLFDAPPAVTKTAPAEASESPAPIEQREWLGYGLKWAKWSRMTGDWDRLRTDLEDRGLSLAVSTIADVSSLAARSSRTQTFGRQLTSFGLTLDLEKIFGLGGSRMFAQYQNMGGANGASRAADSQGFSNIDADPFSQIGEVWLEQQIGTKVRVKAGRIDANSEFAFVENGSDFINSSMGFSPTIFAMPTYPDPHMGLVVRIDPSERLYAAASLFNGGPAMGVADFEATFTMGEAGLRWKRWGGGRLGIGYWRVDGHRADPDDRRHRVATSGQYMVFDQLLWADERDGDARSIAAFVQAGLADPRVWAIRSHVGGGLIGRGFVSGRPDDAIGVGATTVRVASTAGDTPSSSELALGVFYRLAVTKWVALKPDVQFIRHPGGDPARRMLVAGTIRIEVGF